MVSLVHVYHSVHCFQNNNAFCLVTPRFITVPQSVEAFIGTMLNLSCSADGFPVPDITWLFQGMSYTNETVNNTDSTSAESTIVITDLMLSHGGTYTCVIDSDAIIMPQSHDATVVVITGKCMHRSIILPVVYYDTYIDYNCLYSLSILANAMR